MSAEFDPYYTWLGIPPEEQPPHHYRLLGIRALEADRDVITHAMDQRMAHLRTLQSGKHSAHSQRLLNEVSAAAVVLLAPELKRAYDENLARQLSPVTPPPPTAAESSVPPPVAEPKEPPVIVASVGAAGVPRSVVVSAGGILAAALVLAVASYAVRSWNHPVEVADNPRNDQVSHSEVPLVTPPVSPPASAGVEPATAQVPTPEPAKRSPPAAETSNQPAESKTDPPKEVVVPPPVTPTPTPTPVPTPPAETPSGLSATDTPQLPSEAEIEAARAKVIEIYGEEGRQAVKPEQKLALAQRMSQVASETHKDPAVKYALVDTARRLYAGAGEADLALAAVVVLADEFDEDAWDARRSTLAATADAPLPGDKRDRLARLLVTLVDQAVAEEEFDSADELARLAVKVGNRSSDAAVRRSVVQKRTELTRLVDLRQSVESAREKLASAADDPAANLVVGKFLCFVIADFEQGIPAFVAKRPGTVCGRRPRRSGRSARLARGRGEGGGRLVRAGRERENERQGPGCRRAASGPPLVRADRFPAFRIGKSPRRKANPGNRRGCCRCADAARRIRSVPRQGQGKERSGETQRESGQSGGPGRVGTYWPRHCRWPG